MRGVEFFEFGMTNYTIICIQCLRKMTLNLSKGVFCLKIFDQNSGRVCKKSYVDCVNYFSSIEFIENLLKAIISIFA